MIVYTREGAATPAAIDDCIHTGPAGAAAAGGKQVASGTGGSQGMPRQAYRPTQEGDNRDAMGQRYGPPLRYFARKKSREKYVHKIHMMMINEF